MKEKMNENTKGAVGKGEQWEKENRRKRRAVEMLYFLCCCRKNRAVVCAREMPVKRTSKEEK